jgi:hypothetical protein
MSGPVYRRLREASSSAQVSPVQVKCITPATQSFPVDTAVACKLRIDRYMWKFRFYVVEDLIYPVILGSDFLGKTGLLVDIREGFAFFRFAPLVSCLWLGADQLLVCPRYASLRRMAWTCVAHVGAGNYSSINISVFEPDISGT